MNMHADTKAKWLEHLRGGKVRKCVGVYRKYDRAHQEYSYCALGVLVHLVGGIVDDEPYWRMLERLGFHVANNGDWTRFLAITDLSDRYATFEPVAKYIEENL